MTTEDPRDCEIDPMQQTLAVQIAVMPGAEDLPLPRYQTENAAAMDLHAAVPNECDVAPGTIHVIPCGFRIAIPLGYEAQVRPRSGFAAKNGLMVANSPGTIDADYRGEIKVILLNGGSCSFTVTRGMRIAQLVFAPVARAVWEPVPSLPASKRGIDGFGHTGVE